MDELLRRDGRQRLDEGRVHVWIESLGQLAAWGNPKGWALRNSSVRLNQSRAYVEHFDQSSCCFDTILVDGRFRHACLMHALKLSHSSTNVVVHDSQRYVTPGRQTRADKLYDVQLQIGQLAVLRPKPSSLLAARSGSLDSAYYEGILDNPAR